MLLLFIFAFIGCNLQRYMLYYPSSDVPSQKALSALHLQFWPAGPDRYRGFVSVASAGAKGTIVVFHGNAGTAADRDFYVSALAPLGYRVILAEYPGYGERKGSPGEEVFLSDAKETLRLASEQYGRPLFLLGESLGCGVVGSVVKLSPGSFDGLILITPWDTLLSVAKTHFPWLPVRLFLRDTYDTIGNLRDYPGKIAVIGAEQDEVIPIRHAQKLYASLLDNKKMWTVIGAKHNDWPDAVGPAWWREITGFMEGNQK